MSPDVKNRFSHVTGQLEMSGGQTIEHLALDTAQGALIGSGIAAIGSLAQNGYGSAEKEITQLLRENKEKASKYCIRRLAKKTPEAISKSLDQAITNLNNIDINPPGKHCDQTSSYEHTVFTEVAKQTGSILVDEAFAAATDYGKSLARQQLPKTLFTIGKDAIKAEDMLYGAAIGGSIGLVHALYTMKPIQEAPINRIYCRNA